MVFILPLEGINVTIVPQQCSQQMIFKVILKRVLRSGIKHSDLKNIDIWTFCEDMFSLILTFWKNLNYYNSFYPHVKILNSLALIMHLCYILNDARKNTKEL